MKASNKILHEKQYAERILEITGDTMFFVYKDGTCLDFKPLTDRTSISKRKKW